MKILYISTSFPKPNRGATIYTDIAESLHEAGHEIVVVVSEQIRNQNQTTFGAERGFNVLRVAVGDLYDVSFLKKGITTLKLPVLMKKAIRKYLTKMEFDFVLFEAPPVTSGNLVSWAKKKYNCPSYLMLKDIFPQNAVDLDIVKKGGALYRYFKRKEHKLYKAADIVGCMSEANKEYLLKHNSNLSCEKIEIFPNTKKITNDYKTDDNIFRAKYNIADDAKIFLFGGNMGRPQYIDLLCYAVDECKDEKNIFFLFVGRGTDRYKLENLIKEKNIKNALVIENLPRDEYEQITKECNVGLIVLDPRFTIPNYPSRILSYMEYAKPVLAATDDVSDINKLIDDAKCGQWIGSYNRDGFVAKIKDMSQGSNLDSMGKNGRQWIEEKLNIKDSVNILEKHFNSRSR